MSAPTSTAVQWISNGVVVGTQTSYTVAPADIGHTITAAVTASNSAGSVVNTSAPSAPVASATSDLVDDTWVGANGTGWSTTIWNLSGVNAVGLPGGAIADIQNNSGRLATGSGTAYISDANAHTVLTVLDANAVVTMTPQTGGAEQYGTLAVRCDGAWSGSAPNTGYSLFMDFLKGQYQVVKTVSGTLTFLATIPGITPNVATRARLQVVGSTITARVWLANVPEPVTWDTTITDTDIATAGSIGLTTQNGGSGDSTSILFDDFAVSAPGGIVVVVPPVPSSIPSITGLAQVGQTLTEADGTWSGLPTFARQWTRDGAVIAGAQGTTYTLVTGDLTHAIAVAVTATNSAGSRTSVSTATLPVAAAPTALLTDSWTQTNGTAWNSSNWVTSVSGGAVADVQGNQGRLLTGAGSFTAPALAHTVLSETDISAVVTMTPQTGGVEQYGILAVRASATYSGSEPATGYILELDFRDLNYKVVKTVSATQTVLTTVSGVASAAALRCRIQILGSTLSTRVWPATSVEPTTWDYTVIDTDISAAGFVTLTSQNGGVSGATTILFDDFSMQTPVLPVPANTFPPTITGTVAVADVLTAGNGTWSFSPTTYTYQWNRGVAPIAGATASTYTLVTADQSSTMSVTVTATNSTGSASVTSAATGPVGAPGSAGGGPGPVSTAGFITRSGSQLFLPSGARWRYVGFGGFTWMGCGSPQLPTPNSAQIATLMSKFRPASCFRLHGARMAQAYGSANGGFVDSNNAVAATVDRMVQAAKAAGQYVIISLLDFNGECSSPDKALAGNPGFFAGGAPFPAWKTWVGQFCAYYANEPTVCMYEIINEPRGSSIGSSVNLLNFYSTMSTFVKSVAPNQLIETGTYGNYYTGVVDAANGGGAECIVEYKAINALPNVDVANVHDYNGVNDPISNAVGDGGNTSGKPMIVGEWNCSTNGYTDTSATHCTSSFFSGSPSASTPSVKAMMDSFSAVPVLAGINVWAWDVSVIGSSYETSVFYASHQI